MLKKRIVLIIVSIFVLFGVSCSSQPDKDTGGENIQTGSETPTISIYLMKNHSMLIEDALWNYDGVSIKARYFTELNEYYDKLPVELLAGEGPDIINTYLFPTSVQKLFSSEILTDLNGLIDEYKDFNLADYNKVILDSGVSGGKRYLIPTNFIVPFFYTTKSIMGKNGIDADIDNWTWDTMVQIADDFRKQNISTDKYLFQSEIGPIASFMDLLSASGFKFIDYENRKSYFNSPEFIEFLEAFKEKIYPVLSPENISAGVTSEYDLLKEERVVMLYQFIFGSPEQLSIQNRNFQSKFDEDMVILPIPSYKGGSGLVAQPQEAIGINAKCKYKKAAFEFIKRLLSKEHHIQHYSFINKITVNNDALLEEKNHYSQEGIVFLPENLLKSFDSIMANINKCDFRDSGYIRIFKNEIADYLNGKKTAEQTSKTINDKAVIYLNE